MAALAIVIMRTTPDDLTRGRVAIAGDPSVSPMAPLTMTSPVKTSWHGRHAVEIRGARTPSAGVSGDSWS